MPHAKPDPVLAATVRALREDRGLTREAMAFQAGITTGSLAHIELAQACPSWETFRRLASALGLSISGLAAAIEAVDTDSLLAVSPTHAVKAGVAMPSAFQRVKRGAMPGARSTAKAPNFPPGSAKRRSSPSVTKVGE